MLRVYNSLTKKKEVFQPLKEGKVKLFVCGPTVYDMAHIGHARTYLAFDFFVKYLKITGYDVFYLQNITDIDDKIIARAQESGISAKELAEKFEAEYLKDMASLGVKNVTKYAKATNHIDEIINQVERLMQTGFAYKIEDGIYFDISKFEDYGKLSKRSVLQAEDAVSRIDESGDKKNKGDFCLWKNSKRGEPFWNSPWGPGRPGWHIEDTAITEKYLGQQYDIHGGGRDLMFPHHEAEIAQMEAISGKKPLVKYWMHTGFLTIAGQKMSKSLGNFTTIRDFLSENSARLLRLMIFKTHYRSPFDYSEKEIQEVKNQLKRMDEFYNRVQNAKTNLNIKAEKKIDALLSKSEKSFMAALADDFNTPLATAAIFDLIKETNKLLDKNKIDQNSVQEIFSFLKKLDNICEFIIPEEKFENIPPEIIELANSREKFRKDGQWQKADEVRDKILKKGYELKDTKNGSLIRRL